MTELHVHAIKVGAGASSMDGEPPHCHVPSNEGAVLEARDPLGRPLDHIHVLGQSAVVYSSAGRPVAGDGR